MARSIPRSSAAILGLAWGCSASEPSTEVRAVAEPAGTAADSAPEPSAPAGPAPAGPAPAGPAPAGPAPAAAEPSTSIGSAQEGSLRGGVALPLSGPGFRYRPGRDPARRFGTMELVASLQRAAAAVEREHPGSELQVGELSLEHGGDISGHGSHRSGRDVDVMYFLEDVHGKPFPAKAIPLDPRGRGTDYRDLADPRDDVPVRLDVARTWAFLAAMVEDEHAVVQRIFVVEHLRSRLLAHARRIRAPAPVIERFADVTCQPEFPHDDHLHVRVFCTPDDIRAGCLDGPPIYPFWRERLAAMGVAPVSAGPRTSERPKLTTPAEARAAAGPMHDSVREFLDRRQRWSKKPHPGRRWCR